MPDDKVNGKTCLICDCERTMPLDAAALAQALELSAPPQIHTQLCRSQLESFKSALAGGGAGAGRLHAGSAAVHRNAG